jgi:hypothetical protein
MFVAIGGIIGMSFILIDWTQARQQEKLAEQVKQVRLGIVYVPVRAPAGHVVSRGYELIVETRGGNDERLVQESLPRIRDDLRNRLVTLTERRPPDNIDNIEFARGQLRAAANEAIRKVLRLQLGERADRLQVDSVKNIWIDGVVTPPGG